MAKKRGSTKAQGGAEQRKLNAKLLAYCAMAGGALLAAPPAEAAVVYSGVKHLHVGPNNTVAVDLDNNGVNDVRFIAVSYGAHYMALTPLSDNAFVGYGGAVGGVCL